MKLNSIKENICNNVIIYVTQDKERTMPSQTSKIKLLVKAFWESCQFFLQKAPFSLFGWVVNMLLQGISRRNFMKIQVHIRSYHSKSFKKRAA